MFVAPIAVLVLAAGGVWLAWHKLGPGHASRAPVVSSPIQNADEYEKARIERAQRVCDATRARVMRGATVGPTDVEGWVVEIVLARSGADPVGDPALDAFFQKHADGGLRFSWKEAPEIEGQEGIDTEVEMGSEPIVLGDEKAIRITFKGKYVTPYFYSGERRAYVKTANALAEKLGASHGALYARCALGSTHHLGAWFYGSTAGEASASLIYWIGAFADPPQIRQTVLFPDGGDDVRTSGAFERIRERTKGFERTKVRAWLAESEGMISGKDAGPFTLTFPFADANRAARASMALARTAGVGVER
jgi:serine/threonine-protein kinase